MSWIDLVEEEEARRLDDQEERECLRGGNDEIEELQGDISAGQPGRLHGLSQNTQREEDIIVVDTTRPGGNGTKAKTMGASGGAPSGGLYGQLRKQMTTPKNKGMGASEGEEENGNTTFKGRGAPTSDIKNKGRKAIAQRQRRDRERRQREAREGGGAGAEEEMASEEDEGEDAESTSAESVAQSTPGPSTGEIPVFCPPTAPSFTAGPELKVSVVADEVNLRCPGAGGEFFGPEERGVEERSASYFFEGDELDVTTDLDATIMLDVAELVREEMRMGTGSAPQIRAKDAVAFVVLKYNPEIDKYLSLIHI